MKNGLRERARKIKLLITDIDGVWTDTGVYYSENGELLKRFSIRDGMGVQRLRELVNVETGIITGENSGAVKKRAEKLGISEVNLNVRDKAGTLREILQRRGLKSEETAYIGDDVNDIDIMMMAGLSACPADAISSVRKIADFLCDNTGGNGAFRDFAEMIILLKREVTL